MTKKRGDGTKRTKTGRDGGAKKGKTPSKPVSLYPLSEEEALRRLLRVPPPGKGDAPNGSAPAGGATAARTDPPLTIYVRRGRADHAARCTSRQERRGE